MRFLVDENLPFSLIESLQKSGHDVLDIAASRLRGASDEKIWRRAATERRILISKDLDFPLWGLQPYPSGLILIRVPDTFSGKQITRLFTSALKTIRINDLKDQLTIISPGRIRVRKLA
jgi:predicted nuclease of predicted toxin-antitoxin system